MTDNDETISANAEGVDIEVSKEKLKALLEAAEKSGKGIHPDQVRALLGEQQASIPSIRISVRLDENELYHVDYPIILEKDISPAGVQTMWPRMAQEASPAGVQTMWPRAPQEACRGSNNVA